MSDIAIAALHLIARLTAAALLALTSAAFAETTSLDEWQIAQPAAVGLSKEALSAIHQDIESERYGYIDAFLVARHGKLVFERYYEHDYPSIYEQEAATPGALVVNDPSGPYNYFNPWWHPYYRHTTRTPCSRSRNPSCPHWWVSRYPEGISRFMPVLQFFDEANVLNVDRR